MCYTIHAVSLSKMTNSDINFNELALWNGCHKQHRIVKMALSHIISKIRLGPIVLHIAQHYGYCTRVVPSCICSFLAI